MGLVPVDIQADLYFYSGSANGNISPPDIHLVLRGDDIEDFFGLYQGSGGVLSGNSNAKWSGATTITI